jgi:hypothetical protein
MNRRSLLASLLAVAACACVPSSDRRLATLDYLVPAGWSYRNLSTPQHAQVEWKPAGDNGRNECVLILRTPRPSSVTSPPHLVRLLKESQAELEDPKFDLPHRVETRWGLAGVQIAGAFTPKGETASNQRLQAILIDGSALIHVIYTARDPNREVFELVLDSIHTNGT